LPADLRQLDGCRIQILHRSQPRFVTGAGGIAEHLGNQNV
jgi:hypothetical protein